MLQGTREVLKKKKCEELGIFHVRTLFQLGFTSLIVYVWQVVIERRHMGDFHSLPLAQHGDSRVASSFSAQDGHRMREAIADAHRSCASTPNILMPWEMPALSMVFGTSDEPLVPDVPVPLGYVEPVSKSGGHEEPATAIRTKTTAFEHAISFESKRTSHLEEDDQMQLLAQRWEAVISIDYRSFDLGLDLEQLQHCDRVKVVLEVLGGKFIATIRQRLSQLSRYVGWATDHAHRPPFPATAELIKNYVRHLRSESATHSKLTGFMEVMRFAKHVVGLNCQMEAFDSAWVLGIFRSAAQCRPLRKQSTVLTVSAIQHLESLLEDENLAAVDRYATGVFLFAIFARARFGDLRQISSIMIDEAAEANGDQLGYLEAASASHKMRATGNRLGAHLPLVAPLKGLGKAAWGKTFIRVAEQVGLDLASWCPMCPMLPAPNMIGDWTSRPTTSGEIGRWLRQLLLGSLHMVARQQHLPCLPSMEPTRTRG